MITSNELNYLHSQINRIEEKIYGLNDEIENIKGHRIELEELEQKRIYEKEALTQELECLIKRIREKEELKQKEKYDLENSYEPLTSSMKCSASNAEYNRPVASQRIIPVDNDGKPIKELSNGKWSR